MTDSSRDMLFSADLDECHGKWHGNEYRYHVTADFPYFISCFRGRVPSQNKQGLSSDRYRGRRSESANRKRRSFSWKEGAMSNPIIKSMKCQKSFAAGHD